MRSPGRGPAVGEAVPVVRLTEVFRQAAQSRIVVSAHRINQGQMPDLTRPDTETDFYFVPADDPETATATLALSAPSMPKPASWWFPPMVVR